MGRDFLKPDPTQSVLKPDHSRNEFFDTRSNPARRRPGTTEKFEFSCL